MRKFVRQAKFLVRGFTSMEALSADIDQLNRSFSQTLHDFRFSHEARIDELEEFQRAATDHLRQMQTTINEISTTLARRESDLRELRSELAGYSETYKTHLLSVQDRLAHLASREECGA